MKSIVKQKSVLSMALAAATLGSLILTGCSKASLQSSVSANGISTSIVNGQNAAAGDIQASGFANPVVAIFTILDEKTGQGALCTGTLIAPTIVLTAGHCLADATATTSTYVSFQSLDWSNKPGLTVKAKSFVIHPNYAAALANKTVNQVDDLAIILLPAPAPQGVTPATLADSSVSLANLPGVTDVGYGQSDDRNNATDSGAGQLRYTEFSSQQLMNYTGQGPLNGMIIADGEQTSVCHGDSGGPMFVGSPSAASKVIVGVNDLVIPVYSGQQETDYQQAQSSGDTAAFYKKYPDAHICLGYNAFVDVAAHLSWINQTSAQLLAGK